MANVEAASEPAMTTVLACDIGATRVKLGLVRQGQVLAQDILASDSEQGMASRLPAIAESLRRLAAAQGIRIADCAGLSISVPSLIDPGTGRIRSEFGRFRDMPGLDLRAWARSEFHLPCVLENDARMATIGEWRYGAGRGCNDLVMITLGTGLGTSVVLEGRVVRGRHGQAGCLGGHLTVNYSGRQCTCGSIGCAEAEASTKSLAALTRTHANFAASPLAHETVLDYAAVFRHAAASDPCASAIRAHSLLVWSTLAVNLIHAYDPELVIVGGGIMASKDVIVPAIQDFIDRHAHTPWGKVRVVPSALGDAAALVAAQWLVEEHLEKTRT